MSDVAKDVTVRASIQDDTQKGAKSVMHSMDEITRAYKDADEKVNKWVEDAKKKQQDSGSDGGGGDHGHFGRIFSDKSTTGMGTLARGLLSGFGDKLGSALEIGVLAVAAATIDNMAKKAVELSDSFHRGNQDASTMTLELVKMVPIAGSIASIEESIYELMTHQGRVQKEHNDLINEQLKHNQEQYEIYRKLNVEISTFRNQEAELQRETSGIGKRGYDAAVYNRSSEDKKIDDEAALAKQKAQDARDDPSKVNELQNKLETVADVYGAESPQVKLINQEILDAVKVKEDAYKVALAQIAQHKKDQHDQNSAGRVEDKKLRDERINLEAGGADAEHKRAVGDVGSGTFAIMGDVAVSKRHAIQASIEAEKQQAMLAAQARTNATTDAEEQKIIAQQLTVKLEDIKNRGAVQLAAADKEIATTRRKTIFDTAMADQDAAASGEAQRLREVGRGYDAERVLRLQELARRRAEIDQAAAEEIVQNRDNADQIRAKAIADKKKLDDEFKEKDRQAEETRRQGQFDTAKELIQNREDQLNQDARMGDTAAGFEAKRLGIMKEFAEKRAALQKIIRDPNAAPDAKAAAQQQLSGLSEQEKRAQMLANFTGGSGMAGLVMSGHSSGAAAHEREANTDFQTMRREMASLNSTQKAATEATNKLIATLTGKNGEIKFLLTGN